jgi:hypothetical protein
MGNGPVGVDDLWAAAVVDSDAAGLTKTRGCKVAVAAGVFTVTLDRELDEYDCIVSVGVRGNSSAAAYFHNVNHVNDTTKEIRFFFTSGGALQAIPFSVSFRRISNGNM